MNIFRIAVVMLLVISIFSLTGCSKKEQIINANTVYYEGKVVDLSLEKGEILDSNLFAKEMREQGKIIYANQLPVSRNMANFYKVKNISCENRICFGDIDCLANQRCITACKFITGVNAGQIRGCSYDDFKDYVEIEFNVNYGYCMAWKIKGQLQKQEQ